MTEQKQERKVRHLGWYFVPASEAAMDSRLLRWLFRLGSTTGEGKLAAMAKCKKDDFEFRSSLERLIGYGMVVLEPAIHGDAVRVSLTADGAGRAMDLTCEAQLQESGAGAKAWAERQRNEFRG